MGTRILDDSLKNTIRADYARFTEAMPGFKMRPAQWDMIAAAAKSLAVDKGVALIDAPTGIGKSLAYLIAGIPIAKAQNRKMVISTGTVALQEQLLGKDIPLYRKVTGKEFVVAMAKGRGRYACPRNLQELTLGGRQPGLRSGDDEPAWSRPPREGEIELVNELSEQLRTSVWDGDLDNAGKDIPPALKPLITTTSGACTGQQCEFAYACPFFKARKQIEQADVIVANHALVMADLCMTSDTGPGGVILPSPAESIYVFDEGHHLERAAIEASAATVAITSLVDQAKKHDRPFRQAFRALNGNAIGNLKLESVLEDIRQYQLAAARMEMAMYTLWTPEAGHYDATWTAPLGVLPRSLLDVAVELASLSSAISRAAAMVYDAVDQADLADRVTEKLCRSLGRLKEAYDSQYQLWSIWQCPDDDAIAPNARWATQKGRALHLYASAISAKDVLHDLLWPNASSVLITSATLAIGDSFANIKARLGTPPQAIERKLESPFDIQRNGQLIIPWMDFLPNESERHTSAVVAWLIKENHWKQGNLVLFTSKKKMQAVYEALPESLKATIKVQADGVNKAKLLAEHRADIQSGLGSTLFGLESFGTGLDLPGELCTSVIITQLPFAVPTEPVGMTLAAYCQKRKGNPFHDITIPDTIRTMAQYAGRLLRTETDRGRVVVLDRRLVLHPYGRTIIKALPPFTCRAGKPAFAEIV